MSFNMDRFRFPPSPKLQTGLGGFPQLPRTQVVPQAAQPFQLPQGIAGLNTEQQFTLPNGQTIDLAQIQANLAGLNLPGLQLPTPADTTQEVPPTLNARGEPLSARQMEEHIRSSKQMANARGRRDPFPLPAEEYIRANQNFTQAPAVETPSPLAPQLAPASPVAPQLAPPPPTVAPSPVAPTTGLAPSGRRAPTTGLPIPSPIASPVLPTPAPIASPIALGSS